MESFIFALFEQKNLEQQLLRNHNEQNIRDFSRFLAAYFANFRLICSKNTECSLPSLFCLDEDIAKNSNFYEISRHQVSINLPINYTPNLAAQLLFKSNLLLETVFFVEQFNDMRSALIIRHLIDLKCNLNLLDDYCHRELNEKFFTQLPLMIEDGLSDQTYAYLIKLVDILVQTSIVFNYKLLDVFSGNLIERIELLSSGFDEEIPEVIALPRPPIYALPSESLFEQELSKELRIWNEIHYLMKTYFLLLQRTNRLNTTLQQTTAWLCRLNVDFETEISTLLALESTQIEVEILDQFHRILLVILRINSRDSLCSAIRCNDPEDSIDELTQKYIQLFPSNDIKNTLERWAETASHSDFTQVMLFFQFIQDNSQQTECYLPPLSDETLEKWSSMIFMQVRDHQYSNDRLNILTNDDKIKISEYDFKRLQFIANSLPYLSLNDPSLIQISLQLQPTDFCSKTISSQIFESNEIPQKTIDSQQDLRQQIRETIRRLGRQTLTTRAESLRHLPHLIDDFNSHLPLNEYKKDQQFFSTIHYLTTSTRPKLQRSLSERQLMKTKSLWQPKQTFKIERKSEDLGDELKAISARLSKLRQKWEGTDGIVKKEVPVMSSGISSSSSSQADFVENLTTKQKRYRKRRPKNNVYSSKDEVIESLDEFKLDYGSGEQSLAEEFNKTYELEKVEDAIDDEIEEVIDDAIDDENKDVIEDNHSFEQAPIDLSLVPITPESIARLDFSLLSDRDDKPKRRESGAWSEVSILEKSPTKTKRTQMKTAKTAKIQNIYPDWLTLLPLEDKSTSSRLLDLNFYKNRKDTQEPLNLQLKHTSNKVYDSGFLESERETKNVEPILNQFPAPVFDMSANEVNNLIAQCDNN